MRVSKHAQGRRARFRSARVALRYGHKTINKSRQQRGRRQHKFPPNRWHVRASSPFPRSFPTTATTCRRPSPPLACKTRSSCICNREMLGSQNPTRARGNWYFNIYDKSCSGRDRPPWNSQYPHPQATPPDKVVWAGTNKSFLQFSILMAPDPLTTFYGDWKSWFGAHFRPVIGETAFCNYSGYLARARERDVTHEFNWRCAIHISWTSRDIPDTC